jgi:hypothetical protein
MDTDELVMEKPTTVSSSPVKTIRSQEKKKVDPPPSDLKSHWRGFPLSDFNTNLRLKPICLSNSNNSDDKHIVCVEFCKYKEGSVPVPHPPAHNGFPRDMWDSHHVRMPFSQENLFPISLSNGKKDLRKRYFKFIFSICEKNSIIQIEAEIYSLENIIQTEALKFTFAVR